MSHGCGYAARQGLPDSITAGGKTRTVSRHLQENPHPGITAERIEHILDTWVVRGNCVHSTGSRTITYWGFVPGLPRMVRVAVSLDDERIVTAYQYRTATAN